MNNVTVKGMSWNSESAVHLLPACDDTYTLNDVALDVYNQNVSLFGVFDGDKHIASMILRMDGENENKELVVVAGGGYLKGASLYKILTPVVEKLAFKNGAKFLRGHCSKKGIATLMENAGWGFSEYVYRKEVSYGR